MTRILLTSPALRIETPQIFPSNPTPSYVAPWTITDPTRSASSVVCLVILDNPRLGSTHSRCLDDFLYDWKVVQALFNE